MSRRLAGLIPVLAALGLAGPATAGAAVLPFEAGGHFKTVKVGGDEFIAYECEAVAPGAVSVSLDCTFNGSRAGLALPGAASAVFTDLVLKPIGTNTICWSATATYTNASRLTKSGCTSQEVVG
jgi:hypothetical protein